MSSLIPTYTLGSSSAVCTEYLQHCAYQLPYQHRRYDDARRADLPDDVRPLIARNYEDEARHIAWIKQAISSRAWSAEPGAKSAT